MLAVCLPIVGCGSNLDEEAGVLASETDGVDPTVTIAPTTESSSDSSVETAADEIAADETDQLFPDVVGVTASQDADGSWTFNVTLSSPYDSPQRYADAWRVVGPDGEVYGERLLLHDHAAEQPFTRSQSGIVIPKGIEQVTVEGRDQVSGWGGATMAYALQP